MFRGIDLRLREKFVVLSLDNLELLEKFLFFLVEFSELPEKFLRHLVLFQFQPVLTFAILTEEMVITIVILLLLELLQLFLDSRLINSLSFLL